MNKTQVYLDLSNVVVQVLRRSRFLWQWEVTGYVKGAPRSFAHVGFTYTQRGAYKHVRTALLSHAIREE